MIKLIKKVIFKFINSDLRVTGNTFINDIY